jgi:predicted nuclease with TOPRIM domain
LAVSQETLTIIGVGIALAGIIFASNGQLGDRIDRLDARLDRLEIRIGRLETLIGRIETRMDQLETRVDHLDVRLAAVEKETARVIGFLEGSDVTGHSSSSHRSSAEGEDVGAEPLLPRTSLPG